MDIIPKTTLAKMSLTELKALARELQRKDYTHAPQFIPRENRSIYVARIDKYFKERGVKEREELQQMSLL
jgi:tRNA(Glu) U13 pseudouridine synthase TruD